MPADPVDMVDDLAKMGVYKPEAFNVADAISQAEVRKQLFLAMASKGDPKREKLILDLARLAGGLDQAFAAAFGPQAGNFFGDARRTSDFTRRQFIKSIAAGAAMLALA
ncbi:MAG: twin-arginine translocation signal domain-containing protein, partial [Cyanobacteria bacterium P01_G01_bin.4]